MREELTIARLLNEVQAEEMTMTAVLHRLIDDNWDPTPRCSCVSCPKRTRLSPALRARSILRLRSGYG